MKTNIATIQISDKWARIFQLLTLSMLVMSMQVLFGESPPVLAWSCMFGGSNDDRGHSVQQTADLGYIVAGYMKKIGGEDSDLYLLKTDSTGDQKWSLIKNSTDHMYGYSVYQTSDTGFIVRGYTSSSGGEDGDLYLLKTGSSGDTMWTKNPDTFFTNRIYSVQQTAEGGYIVCGYKDNKKGGGGEDVLLEKYKYELIGIEEESFQKHIHLFQRGSNPFKDSNEL